MPPARPGCPILPGLLRRDRVSSEPHRRGGSENLRTLERRGLQILPLHAGPCRKTCEVAGFSIWIARTLTLRVESRSISTRALSSGACPGGQKSLPSQTSVPRTRLSSMPARVAEWRVILVIRE